MRGSIFYLGEETHPEPKRLIVFTFIVGMAFGFFTVAIENIFSGWASGIGIQELSLLSLFGLAAIEEMMKFSAAHFAVNRNPEFTEPVDAMIYMIVAALGFATLENIGAIAGITPPAAIVPTVLRDDIPAVRGRHAPPHAHVGHRRLLLGARHGARARWRAMSSSASPIAAILHTTFNYLILTYGDAVYSVIFLIVVGFFVLDDFERSSRNQ